MVIWCQNDVVLTSVRRNQVTSTLIQRHFLRHVPAGQFGGEGGPG